MAFGKESKTQQAVSEGAENSTAQVPATISQRALASVKSPGGRTFKVAKQVTRPILTQKENDPIFVLFTSKMKVAELQGKVKEGEEALPPPMIAEITNLDTDQLMMLVCGKVLERELNQKYPNDSYINKGFRLVSVLASVKGKAGQRMRLYDIQELDLS